MKGYYSEVWKKVKEDCRMNILEEMLLDVSVLLIFGYSIYLFMYLSICLSINLSIDLFVILSFSF